MTPDAPLVCAWAVAMYCFHRAIRGSEWYWLLTGLALGVGLLAKYTMAYLAVAFAFYLILVERRHFRTWGPYAMVVIAYACCVGVLYWNAANDWISFRHTAQIGNEAERSVVDAASQFGEFVGGQVGVVSPLLFGLVVWGVWRCTRLGRSNPDAAFLCLCSAVVLVAYAFTSLFRAPQPNWPVCAYVGGVICLAWQWSERESTRVSRRVMTAAIVLGVCLGVVLRTTGVWYAIAPEGEQRDRLNLMGMSIDPDRDPTNALIGGAELGGALSRAIGEWPRETPFVFSDRYQLTALAAFYTDGRPRTYCMNLGNRRLNQYDLWGGWEELRDRSAIFVTGGSEARAQAFVRHLLEEKYFRDGHVLDVIEVKRGDTVVKTYTLSALFRYSGKVWPSAEGAY